MRASTLPEGITTLQAVALLQAAEGLAGEVTAVPTEGELLPDTYHYSWGDLRDRMLARQRRAMADTLNHVEAALTLGKVSARMFTIYRIHRLGSGGIH